MKQPLNHHHRLLPGSTQLSSLVAALAPASFQLDDRRWQEFFTTAHRYAEWLTYYNAAGEPDGNWQFFWELEPITYLAVLAAEDVDQIRQDYETVEQELAEALIRYQNPNDHTCTDDPEPAYLLRLIELIRQLAVRLEQHYRKLATLGHPLAGEVLRLIRRDNDCDPEELQGALQRLVRAHKRANPPATPEQQRTRRDIELDYRLYEIFFAEDGSQGHWGVDDRDAFDGIPAQATLPQREALRVLFKTFLDVLSVAKSRAQAAFAVELARMEQPESAEYRVVQPHIALFVTFLHLFRYLQEDLNGLPSRHLDFYYEQVLGLQRRPAQSDSAYLIFTLAKEFQEQVLAKGTLVLGGKDPGGRPIYYATLADERLTQAQLVEIKTLFYEKNAATGLETLKAAPVANSADGLGEAFKKGDDDAWRLFADDPTRVPNGEIGFVLSSPQLLLREGYRAIKIDLTSTAEASPLFPQEWRIQFLTADGWSEVPVSQDPALTWADRLVLPDDAGANAVLPAAATYRVLPGTAAAPTASVLITLPKSFPAVENSRSTLGAVRFLLPTPDSQRTVQYANLLAQNLSPDNPVAITVRAVGIQKNLILQNDTGSFDGTEKFLPFGPQAEHGARFYLGCDEALQKKITYASLDFDWVDYKPRTVFDTSANGYYVNYLASPAISGTFTAALLEDGNFKKDETIPEISGGDDDSELGLLRAAVAVGAEILPNLDLLNAARQLKTNIPLTQTIAALTTVRTDDLVAAPRLPIFGFPGLGDVVGNLFNGLGLSTIFTGITLAAPKFTFDAKGGFLRFTFTGNFLHKEYPKILAAAAKDTVSGDLVVQAAAEAAGAEGATPASVVVAARERANQIPSGYPNPPYTPATNGISLNYEAVDNQGISLVWATPFGGAQYPGELPGQPLAQRLAPGETEPFDATTSLYLGFEQLTAGDKISLLFELAPDSERDFEADAPAIHWYYLRGNDWAKFPPDALLRDSTRQFTQSGLVQLAVPNDLSSKGTTILNPSLHWLRACAVGGDVRALPSARSIRAQALEVRFLDQNNDPAHLAAPQAPDTITKLALSDSAVKSIAQPLPSFGGRLPEGAGSPDFFRRISERLRHRDRAVTAWDFEHLLLEFAPAVATAKCIQHTRYQGIAEQLAPGFVTVAVIPDLSDRAANRRAQPRLPKGQLDDLRDYLLKKTNLFLGEPVGPTGRKLSVVNPLYESLRVEVQLAFYDGDLNLFKLLADRALQRFIAPWVEDLTQQPAFGRSLYRSQVYVLLEELEFVDYVADLKIYRRLSPDTPEEELVGDLLLPATARSIFTTASAHEVAEYPPPVAVSANPPTAPAATTPVADTRPTTSGKATRKASRPRPI